MAPLEEPHVDESASEPASPSPLGKLVVYETTASDPLVPLWFHGDLADVMALDEDALENGLTLGTRIDPHDLERVIDEISRAAATQTPIEITYRVQHPGGGEHRVRERVFPGPGVQGEIRLHHVAIDVTRHDATEAGTRAQDAIYRDSSVSLESRARKRSARPPSSWTSGKTPKTASIS